MGIFTLKRLKTTYFIGERCSFVTSCFILNTHFCRCDIRDSRMSQRNVSLTVSKCENFGPIFPIIKW